MATYLPFSDVVAAYGYRQPERVRNHGNLLMLAVAYVVMGTALGTVAGTSLAMASFHSGLPTLSFRVVSPVQADSTVASTARPQAQPVALASQAIAVPASVPTAAPVSLLTSTPVNSESATHASAKVAKTNFAVVNHDRHAGHLKSPIIESAVPADSTQLAISSQVAIMAPVSTATVDTDAKSSYTFFSEGDATVADFDATMGTIETYEGKTFMIGTSAPALAAGSLQESGFSIHYRCNQGGNCTLTQHGQVMQNARLM